MKKIALILICGLMASGLSGCSNMVAKQFGGTMKIELPKGKKLVNATWKEGGQFWYLVRNAKSNEVPETLEFCEKSPTGMMEGKVIITER